MSNSSEPLSVLAKLMFQMLLFALPDRLSVIPCTFLINFIEIAVFKKTRRSKL